MFVLKVGFLSRLLVVALHSVAVLGVLCRLGHVAGGRCLPVCGSSPKGEAAHLPSSVVREAKIELIIFTSGRTRARGFQSTGQSGDPGLKWKHKAASLGKSTGTVVGGVCPRVLGSVCASVWSGASTLVANYFS